MAHGFEANDKLENNLTQTKRSAACNTQHWLPSARDEACGCACSEGVGDSQAQRAISTEVAPQRVAQLELQRHEA